MKTKSKVSHAKSVDEAISNLQVFLDADFESKQDDMPGMHQIRLFETVANMLENNMVDTSNALVMRSLIKIHRLLTPLVPVRVSKNK